MVTPCTIKYWDENAGNASTRKTGFNYMNTVDTIHFLLTLFFIKNGKL